MGRIARADPARRLLRKGQAAWSAYTTGGDRGQQDRAVAILTLAVEQADRAGGSDRGRRLPVQPRYGPRRADETSGAEADVDAGADLPAAAPRSLPEGHQDVPPVYATLAAVSLHRGTAPYWTRPSPCSGDSPTRLPDAGIPFSNLSELLRLRHEQLALSDALAEAGDAEGAATAAGEPPGTRPFPGCSGEAWRAGRAARCRGRAPGSRTRFFTRLLAPPVRGVPVGAVGVRLPRTQLGVAVDGLGPPRCAHRLRRGERVPGRGGPPRRSGVSPSRRRTSRPRRNRRAGARSQPAGWPR